MHNIQSLTVVFGYDAESKKIPENNEKIPLRKVERFQHIVGILGQRLNIPVNTGSVLVLCQWGDTEGSLPATDA